MGKGEGQVGARVQVMTPRAQASACGVRARESGGGRDEGQASGSAPHASRAQGPPGSQWNGAEKGRAGRGSSVAAVVP